MNDNEMSLFRHEIEEIYESEVNPQRRGALIVATKKRHKANFVCNLLLKIAKKERIDLTTVLAKKMLKRFTGKSMAMPKLVANFATPKRTARNKSRDFNRIDEVCDKYHCYVQHHLSNTESSLEHVLRWVKNEQEYKKRISSKKFKKEEAARFMHINLFDRHKVS